MQIYSRIVILFMPASIIRSLNMRYTSYAILTPPFLPSQTSNKKTPSVRLHPPKISILAWNLRNPITLSYLTMNRPDSLPWDIPVHLLWPIILHLHEPLPLCWTYVSRIIINHSHKTMYIYLDVNSPLDLMFPYDQKKYTASQQLSAMLNPTQLMVVIGTIFKGNFASILEFTPPLLLFQPQPRHMYV